MAGRLIRRGWLSRRPQARSVLVRYGLAVILVALSATTRILLGSLIEQRAPMLLFTLGVLGSAWFGGLGPGAFATLLSAIGGYILFIDPQLSHGFSEPAGFVHASLFIINGLVISILLERMHGTRERLEERDASLQESEQRYRALFDSIDAGFCVIEVLTDDQGKAKDYRFIEVNKAFAQQTGLVNPIGKTMRELVPHHESRWYEIYGDVARTGESVRFEDYSRPLNRWFEVFVFRFATGKPTVGILFRDISHRKSAEIAKARLAAIVESSEDAILSKDLNGTITSWNRGAERLFGYTAAEAIGQPVSILIPKEHADEEPSILARIRQGERIEHYDTVRRSKNGVIYNISLSVSPITDAEGKIIGASSIGRDVTARRRTEAALSESEARYRTLIEQVKDYAIFRMDKEGRPTSWNEGVRRVLGFEEAEFIGQDIAPIIFTPEDLRNGVPTREMEMALERGSADNNRWMRRKDGTRFFAVGVTTAMRDAHGQHVSFSKVLHDQTASKRSEETLAQSRAELESYADNLERTVSERTAELRQTVRSLEELLYALAHDLRAPNRAMQGYSHLLESEYGDRLDDVARGYLRRISAAAVRNDSLIRDLLQLGQLGHTQVPVSELDPRRVAQAAVDELPLQAREREASVQISDGDWPKVCANETLLMRVFGEFLTNAIKYVPVGRQPRIQVSAKKEDSSVVLSVKDNGPGIPTEQQGNIFEPFTRLGSADGVEGTGMGLALVRKAAERMGGMAGVDNHPGQGSCFWVRLPMAPLSEGKD